MHLLSDDNRKEFQETLQLIRFDYPYGDKEREPTLLIQASTLILKYIIQKCKIDLLFKLINNKLLYALRVWDDNEHPACLWSILVRVEEKDALMQLVKGGTCHVFLFNEIGINSAWKTIELNESVDLFNMVLNCTIGPLIQDDYQNEVSTALDKLNSEAMDQFVIIKMNNSGDWRFIQSAYITNQIQKCKLDLPKDIEGSHQENVALWLIDNIHPQGAFHSPQIHQGKGKREFTDLLLTYNNGCFLIESKALSILCRDKFPSRDELIDDNNKHIEKAIKQLKGAVRQLQLGTTIFSFSGEKISIERTKPCHCIILISDLGLTPKNDLIGLKSIKDFMESSKSYLHLVDPSELKRIVQAASMISNTSKNISQIQAFDYYLLERAKKTIQAGTLNIEVLLRIVNE